MVREHVCGGPLDALFVRAGLHPGSLWLHGRTVVRHGAQVRRCGCYDSGDDGRSYRNAGRQHQAAVLPEQYGALRPMEPIGSSDTMEEPSAFARVNTLTGTLTILSRSPCDASVSNSGVYGLLHHQALLQSDNRPCLIDIRHIIKYEFDLQLPFGKGPDWLNQSQQMGECVLGGGN